MNRLREALRLRAEVFRLDELGKPMAAGHELGQARSISRATCEMRRISSRSAGASDAGCWAAAPCHTACSRRLGWVPFQPAHTGEPVSSCAKGVVHAGTCAFGEPEIAPSPVLSLEASLDVHRRSRASVRAAQFRARA